MTEVAQEKTGLGNYFVANYPPFSAWKPDFLPDARAALNSDPVPGTPLGLYLHIPFCRKRCKFCYFRVYTDKNARDVENYTDALIKEVELYARVPLVGGRPFTYVYFGGGTPSYLSAAQLRDLMTRLKAVMPWEGAEEVTFECEPGTLQQHKLETLREMGVTRLSLGVENFDPKILEYNGRAHLEEEIHRAWGWARDLGFDQINLDLIAGMVGETWDNWKQCVAKTIALSPDSVTIYQMELPYNTVFSKELRVLGQDEPPSEPIADWPTKRAWVNYAYDTLLAAGYEVSSAYTLVKNKQHGKFVYRDGLWHGADMFGTGVASFGHVHGVHLQNVDSWEQYVGALDRGELPLGRALPVAPHQLLIREMILQMKTGRLQADYFRRKFGVDILTKFGDGFAELEGEGFLERKDDGVVLTRAGLLQADRLLPTFFEPQYRGDALYLIRHLPEGAPVQTETARLLLRPLAPADLDDLCGITRDPEVMRYIGLGVRSRKETEQGLARTVGYWSRLGYGMWAAFEKETGRFIGRCGIQPLADTAEVELGYTLHREFWGRGYATEGSHAALRFGFGTVGLDHIVAIARPENTASRRVMEKVGMTFERIVPSPYGHHDVAWYGLSRERYQELFPPAPAGPAH